MDIKTGHSHVSLLFHARNLSPSDTERIDLLTGKIIFSGSERTISAEFYKGSKDFF